MNLTVNPKLASYIGLAQRSGSVVYGIDRITENPRVCKILVVDSAAQEKNKRKLNSLNVEVLEVENLSEYLHRENVAAVGITNPDLAQAIHNLR